MNDLTPEEHRRMFHPSVHEEAEDMLLNAEIRVGGAVGIGSREAEAWLRGRLFIGPGGGLTNKGVKRARALYRNYWEEQ